MKAEHFHHHRGTTGGKDGRSGDPRGRNESTEKPVNGALFFHFHIHHDIYKLLQQSMNKPEEEEERRNEAPGTHITCWLSTGGEGRGLRRRCVYVCVNESGAFWVCAG